MPFISSGHPWVHPPVRACPGHAAREAWVALLSQGVRFVGATVDSRFSTAVEVVRWWKSDVHPRARDFTPDGGPRSVHTGLMPDDEPADQR